MNTVVVNLYLEGDLHDKFPVNTWYGTPEEVLECVRNLLLNKGSAASRIEVVVNPDHPNYTLGLNPRRLRDE